MKKPLDQEDLKDAYRKGKERPDLALIFTDKGVWHRNPFCLNPDSKAFWVSQIVAKTHIDYKFCPIDTVLWRRAKTNRKVI